MRLNSRKLTLTLILLLAPLHGAAANGDIDLPRATVDLPPSPRIPFVMGPIDGPPPMHLTSGIRLDNVTAHVYIEDSGVRVEYSMDIRFTGYDSSREPPGQLAHFWICPIRGTACAIEPVFTNVTQEHVHLDITSHHVEAASPAQCVWLTYQFLEGHGGGRSNWYCLHPEHYAVDV